VSYIKYWKKTTNVFLFVLSFLFKLKPKIVVHEANPSILSLPLVFFFCKISRAKFVLWGHGYNRNSIFNPSRYFKSYVRLLYLRLADAVIFYDYTTMIFFRKYLDSNKLFVAQNTIDTKKLTSIAKEFDIIGKNRIKKEIGFTADFNIIFIGRLLFEKDPFSALKIFEKVKNKFKGQTINLHFIGDGPARNHLIEYIKKNNLGSEVKLYGAIYDDIKIGKLLYGSDLVINPGYVGLNVNQSFCFNIPVFTFSQSASGPFHSPEVEYLKDGETGFFAEPYDYNELAEKIINYLKSTILQENLKSNIKFMVENVITIDNMLKGFTDCFEYLLVK